jgi:hypothetical protein
MSTPWEGNRGDLRREGVGGSSLENRSVDQWLSINTPINYFLNRLSLLYVPARQPTQTTSPPTFPFLLSPHFPLHIHFSSSDLPTHPFSVAICAFFILNSTSFWCEFSFTEICVPDLKCLKTFSVVYSFEREQHIHFVISIVNSETFFITSTNTNGAVEITLQTFVSRGCAISFQLSFVTLLMALEQHQNSGQMVSGCLSVSDLKKMRTFSRNFPFFQIENSQTIVIYQSEIIPKCSGDTQFEFAISLTGICECDLQQPLVFPTTQSKVRFVRFV